MSKIRAILKPDDLRVSEYWTSPVFEYLLCNNKIKVGIFNHVNLELSQKEREHAVPSKAVLYTNTSNTVLVTWVSAKGFKRGQIFGFSPTGG